MIDDVVIYVTAILMTMNKQLIVESFSIENVFEMYRWLLWNHW